MKKSICFFMLATLFLVLIAGCSNQQAVQSLEGEQTKQPSQEKYVMKICCATTGDIQAESLEKLKEYIERESGGRIEVQTYPGSQMGSGDQVHQQLLSGAIQGIMEPTSFMAGFCDELTMVDLPYLFDFDSYTLRDICYLVNGPAGEELRKSVESKNLICNSIQVVDLRCLLAKFEVKSLDDFKNKKIRTGNKVLQEQWVALGGVGVPMGVPELYTALQQGAIDGIDSSLPFFYAGKYIDVAKYYLDEPFGVMASTYLLNKKFVEDLPEDLQKIVLDSGPAILEWRIEASKEFTDFALEESIKQGVTVSTVSPELHDQMKELCMRVHEIFLEENPGYREVYESLTSALAKL